MSTLLLSSVFSSQKNGARFQVKSEHTIYIPIKPEIYYNAPHGMTAFVFDMSLMMNMGMLLGARIK